nr:hypothetical protein 2 [Wuhan heteroptera virus 3]
MEPKNFKITKPTLKKRQLRKFEPAIDSSSPVPNATGSSFSDDLMAYIDKQLNMSKIGENHIENKCQDIIQKCKQLHSRRSQTKSFKYELKDVEFMFNDAEEYIFHNPNLIDNSTNIAPQLTGKYSEVMELKNFLRDINARLSLDGLDIVLTSLGINLLISNRITAYRTYDAYLTWKEFTTFYILAEVLHLDIKRPRELLNDYFYIVSLSSGERQKSQSDISLTHILDDDSKIKTVAELLKPEGTLYSKALKTTFSSLFTSTLNDLDSDNMNDVVSIEIDQKATELYLKEHLLTYKIATIFAPNKQKDVKKPVIDIIEFLHNIKNEILSAFNLDNEVDELLYEYNLHEIYIGYDETKKMLKVKHPFIFHILNYFCEKSSLKISTSFLFNYHRISYPSNFKLTITTELSLYLGERVFMYLGPISESGRLLAITLGDVFFNQVSLIPFISGLSAIPGRLLIFDPIIRSIRYLYISIGVDLMNDESLKETMTKLERLNDMVANDLKIFLASEDGPIDRHVGYDLKKNETFKLPIRTAATISCGCVTALNDQLYYNTEAHHNIHKPPHGSPIEPFSTILKSVNQDNQHSLYIRNTSHNSHGHLPKLVCAAIAGCNNKIDHSISWYEYKTTNLFSLDGRFEQLPSTLDVLMLTGLCATAIEPRTITQTILIPLDLLCFEDNSKFRLAVIEVFQRLGFLILDPNDLQVMEYFKKPIQRGDPTQITRLMYKIYDFVHVFATQNDNILPINAYLDSIERDKISDYIKKDAKLEITAGVGSVCSPYQYNPINNTTKLFRTSVENCANQISSTPSGKLFHNCLQTSVYALSDSFIKRKIKLPNVVQIYCLMSEKLVGHHCVRGIFNKKPLYTATKDAFCRKCKFRYNFSIRASACAWICEALYKQDDADSNFRSQSHRRRYNRDRSTTRRTRSFLS